MSVCELVVRVFCVCVLVAFYVECRSEEGRPMTREERHRLRFACTSKWGLYLMGLLAGRRPATCSTTRTGPTWRTPIRRMSSCRSAARAGTGGSRRIGATSTIVSASRYQEVNKVKVERKTSDLGQIILWFLVVCGR